MSIQTIKDLKLYEIAFWLYILFFNKNINSTNKLSNLLQYGVKYHIILNCNTKIICLNSQMFT